MWTGAWESLGGARAARRWGAHGAELRGNPHSERFYELDRELHESMRGNVAAWLERRRERKAAAQAV